VNHLPIALLVVALGALCHGLLLTALLPAALRALARVEPASRVRWLVALLASPLASGLLLLALLGSHCIVSLRPGVGLEDGCERLCRLCLWHASPASPLGWALALLCLAPTLSRAARLGVALRASRRAVARLQCVAQVHHAALWSVPGSLSFVAGWPRGVACVGEDIGRDLGTEAEAAVTAHEVAHVARGDVTLRLGGRLLAGAHLPWVGAPLLGALDLAVEQACDAEAARAVPPLVLAETLVAVARLDPSPFWGPALMFSDAGLDDRVRALCGPSWRRATGAACVCAALALAVVAAGITFYDPLHHAGEMVFTWLPV
jgi:hypothetical protein